MSVQGLSTPCDGPAARRIGHELVARAVDREDVAGCGRLRLDLLAQLDHEVVDGAVGRVGLDAPDALQDVVARDGLALALVEQLEQLDLVERELLDAARRVSGCGRRVDGGLAHPERLIGQRCGGAPQHRADAGQQLADRERLGDVVVGARRRGRGSCRPPGRAP
jgi:hypothetical protein